MMKKAIVKRIIFDTVIIIPIGICHNTLLITIANPVIEPSSTLTSGMIVSFYPIQTGPMSRNKKIVLENTIIKTKEKLLNIHYDTDENEYFY